MIIDHNHPAYRARWETSGSNQYNGAFYYSKEIVRNIIPMVETDRHWVTVNIPLHNREPQFHCVGCSHAVVFVHNNLHPENYEWLRRYDDLVLVCCIEETMDKVSHLGTPVCLPLSVDVDYVRQYIRPKTKGAAFVGRPSKRSGYDFGAGVDIIEGLPRTQLLEAMAEYRQVYAVGRTAIEAKILGCEVLPYDRRFPDAERWKILDNRDAATMLQEMLDKIDAE